MEGVAEEPFTAQWILDAEKAVRGEREGTRGLDFFFLTSISFLKVPFISGILLTIASAISIPNMYCVILFLVRTDLIKQVLCARSRSDLIVCATYLLFIPPLL